MEVERRLGWEQPGAMLFLNRWSWVHHARMRGEAYATAPANQASLEAVFDVYRSLNRALVEEAVATSERRRALRLARMEKLAGATERLPSRAGSEKDDHRLLVNDAEPCVDLVTWRARGARPDPVSARFREALRDPVVRDEPGHHKPTGKGRLDIQLVAREDAARVPEGESVLEAPAWRPVAWIDLEAGRLHKHQLLTFLAGHGQHLHAGDFLVAVDRSDDHSPEVAEVRAAAAARGIDFLHVQVPEAFDALEELYGPELHRLSRKRYTLEVIRGLLG